MNKKLLILFSLVAIVVIMNSCYKDKLDFSKLSTTMQWDPNMAVPAIHSTLTIRDLVRDYDSTELFVEDQTGLAARGLCRRCSARTLSVQAAPARPCHPRRDNRLWKQSLQLNPAPVAAHGKKVANWWDRRIV